MTCRRHSLRSFRDSRRRESPDVKSLKTYIRLDQCRRTDFISRFQRTNFFEVFAIKVTFLEVFTMDLYDEDINLEFYTLL